jgi:hypothetical protein
MTPDWFITRAKKLLFALEYGQEYKDAAEILYRDTVRHVLEQIAQDIATPKDGNGISHCWLERRLRPDLAEIYTPLERQAFADLVKAKSGDLCEPGCCEKPCPRAAERNQT